MAYRVIGLFSDMLHINGRDHHHVVPEFVSVSRLTAILYTNTANILREQQKNQHSIVITNVPYHVYEEDASKEL